MNDLNSDPMQNSTAVASAVLNGSSERNWQWKLATMSYILSVYELILVSAKLQIGKRGKKKQN
jgi:hypothetical protein